MLHALWLKIFHVLFKPKVVGNHGRKDIEGVRKAPNIFLEKIKEPKMTSWVLKILMFL
jgi:hypothetical protein